MTSRIAPAVYKVVSNNTYSHFYFQLELRWPSLLSNLVFPDFHLLPPCASAAANGGSVNVEGITLSKPRFLILQKYLGTIDTLRISGLSHFYYSNLSEIVTIHCYANRK